MEWTPGKRLCLHLGALGPAPLTARVRPTLQMRKLIVTLPMVFGAEAAMAWFFYRSRAVSHASWTESDFVVFGLPLLVGFAVSLLVLFLGFPQMSALKRMTMSAVGAVISSFGGGSHKC